MRDIDPRLQLLLLLAACFICQYIPAFLLPVWLVALALLFVPVRRRGRMFRLMLRGGLWFIAFWLVMTVGSDLVGGKSFGEAFRNGLPLAGRLLALTFVGIAHVEYSSPVQTGKACAWFFRPLFGERAWRPALAVALTAWFLPRSLALIGDVRGAMQARGLRLGWRQSVVLGVGTGLRILETKAAEVAVGLASRRGDDARAWRM